MRNILLICFLSSFSVFAADTNKKAEIEELLLLMNTDAMVDSMYSQMSQMMQGMGQQLKVKPKEQAIFKKFTARMFSTMKEEMNWEKMKGPTIEIYAKHFSEKEISDMIAFYKTESGKSMVKKLPAVMTDSMMMGQNMMKNFIPKMQKISQELQSELTKHRQIKKP